MAAKYEGGFKIFGAEKKLCAANIGQIIFPPQLPYCTPSHCVGAGYGNRLPCWSRKCVSMSGISRSQWCAHSA